MENKKGKKQHLVQCIGAKFANWHRGGLLLLLMHPPSSTFSSTPCFPLLTERWLLVHCNIGKSGNQSSTSLERTRSIYIDIVVLSLASLAKICQRPAKKKRSHRTGSCFFLHQSGGERQTKRGVVGPFPYSIVFGCTVRQQPAEPGS